MPLLKTTDAEALIKMLRANGVLSYKDHGVEITLTLEPKDKSQEDLLAEMRTLRGATVRRTT